MDDVLGRFERRGVWDGGEGLRLRAGSVRDYAALAGFHYVSARPATVSRVLVLERRGVSVVGRYVGRGEAREVVGVLVESMPVLRCGMRDAVLGGRYVGWSGRGMGARLLNREVRCISRVVVRPEWRGLGLSVRLVRAALGCAETVYTEAMAAMGRVHPFFERAGMAAHRFWPSERDQRMRDVLESVGLDVWALVSATRVRRWMAGAGEMGVLFERELDRWGGGGSLEANLLCARERLLREVVYYVKRNEVAGDG